MWPAILKVPFFNILVISQGKREGRNRFFALHRHERFFQIDTIILCVC